MLQVNNRPNMDSQRLSQNSSFRDLNMPEANSNSSINNSQHAQTQLSQLQQNQNQEGSRKHHDDLILPRATSLKESESQSSEPKGSVLNSEIMHQSMFLLFGRRFIMDHLREPFNLSLK